MSAGPLIPDELWQQIPPAAQAAIRALIQHYEQRLADLETRLNQNSTNSSKPPSSTPPTPPLQTRPPSTAPHPTCPPTRKPAASTDMPRPNATSTTSPTACWNVSPALAAIANNRCTAMIRNHYVIRSGTCRPFGPSS